MKNQEKPEYNPRTNGFMDDLQYAEIRAGVLAYNIVGISGMGLVVAGLVKLLSEKI
jgi:hypothetical protein